MLLVTDLHTGYAGTEIIKGISFHVPAQSIVTIIGPNGAGKSTTLRAVSGLNLCTAGRIELDGRRTDGLTPQAIVRLGVAHVPEGRRIFPRLTVRENLLLGGFTTKDKALVSRRIDEMLDLFSILRDRSGQLGATLSGGEQQMLALARSLISAPKLLLLDEPSMGLAPLVIERVAAYITDLRKAGMTVLLVEQNASIALEISDYAYVLETGRIIMEGPSAELRHDENVRRSYLGI